MGKRILLILSMFLIFNLCFSSFAFAEENVENNITDIQNKIIKDIEKSVNMELLPSDKDKINNMIKDLPYTEKKEVLIDLRYSTNDIKLSLSEPITVYEEVITRTYDISSNKEIISQFEQDLDLTTKEVAELQSTAYYETRQINTSRTYNGDTTTVKSIIRYYRMDDINMGGTTVDAFSFRSSDISFSSPGYGHVNRITARHYQVGPDLDGTWKNVINGNIYSNHRTDKDFNMYTSSGTAPFARLNSQYSCILPTTSTGGYIGTGYTVYFIWNLGGGGNFGYDTLKRTNNYGSLPY